MRRDWDYKNTIDFAHDKGFEEGREQGLAEGEANGQRTIVKRLLAAGFSAETIAEAVGLPIEYAREMQRI